jgi:flagella basal body P-ring formation protein FlgA
MMRKLRHYILPSLLILVLAVGVGMAQTINKAIQLSQDASGAFGVDTTNNVYFPGHILNTGSAAAAITVTGTGTPTISGTDVAGTITMGASATTATALFGRAYVSVPNCVVSWQSIPNGTAISYTLLTTSINLVQPAGSSNKVNYFCTGAS